MNATLAGLIVELVRSVLPSLIAELRGNDTTEAELAKLRSKVEALESKKVAK